MATTRRLTAVAAADFRIVDVFTASAYAGNPTCVVFPSKPLSEISEEWMAKVAAETNQPTTSFVDADAMAFKLYSSQGELPLLSGHSSLGIAAALMDLDDAKRLGKTVSVTLSSKYGDVSLYQRDGGLYEVAMPAGDGTVQEAPKALITQALHLDAGAILDSGITLGGKFCFAELSAETLATLSPPDLAQITALPSLGLYVTAAGMVTQHAGYTPQCVSGGSSAAASGVVADFTVRNFVPKLGIDEDIATGSIQVALNQHWSAKLGKEASAPSA